MKSISRTIKQKRILKGYTQEELAELSKVNLRTIQRTENGKTIPHDKTLGMICGALGIELTDVKTNRSIKVDNTISLSLVNAAFLVLLNLLFMLTVGYLTLDSNANFNSRVGGVIVSFLVPLFIVFLTQKMGDLARLLKFGLVFLAYAVVLILVQGFPVGFYAGTSTGLFLCILIWIAVLFYGNRMLKTIK